MGRRGFALAAALCLLAPPAARADGATQALAGLGMGVIGGLCLFTSAKVADAAKMDEDEGEEATEVSRWSPRGAYAGVGASFAFEEHRDLMGRSVSDSLGARGLLGMGCSERLAADLDFEWVEGFDVGTKDTHEWSLTANARYHLLIGRVQPFLLAGIGFVSGDVPGFRRRIDAAFRFGGGLLTWATERVGLRLDASYVLPTGSVKDLRYVSLGASVQYRF